MPNHVINEVTLHGVGLDRVRPLLSRPQSALEIDFNVLVPLPINFWWGGVSTKHEKAFPGTGLDAATAQWGTKWNAYGLDEGGRYKSVKEVDGSTVLTFQTAWGPPRGWVVALFNTLECKITHLWLSEGARDARGEEYIVDGRFGDNEWRERVIQEGTDEHKGLHRLLHGVESFEEEGA